jgi:hypothetical protein
MHEMPGGGAIQSGGSSTIQQCAHARVQTKVGMKANVDMKAKGIRNGAFHHNTKHIEAKYTARRLSSTI